jgi:hypothetical protein
LAQLKCIDLGRAVSKIKIHFQDAVAFDQKAYDPLAALFYPHTGQTAAVAQKYRAFKDIRGLKPLDAHQ